MAAQLLANDSGLLDDMILLDGKMTALNTKFDALSGVTTAYPANTILVEAIADNKAIALFATGVYTIASEESDANHCTIDGVVCSLGDFIFLLDCSVSGAPISDLAQITTCSSSIYRATLVSDFDKTKNWWIQTNGGGLVYFNKRLLWYHDALSHISIVKHMLPLLEIAWSSTKPVKAVYHTPAGLSQIGTTPPSTNLATTSTLQCDGVTCGAGDFILCLGAGSSGATGGLTWDGTHLVFTQSYASMGATGRVTVQQGSLYTGHVFLERWSGSNLSLFNAIYNDVTGSVGVTA
jgi:hypothetical protein